MKQKQIQKTKQIEAPKAKDIVQISDAVIRSTSKNVLEEENPKEFVQRALVFRNKLEQTHKLPEEYMELVRKARSTMSSVIRKTATEYIPQMHDVLVENKFHVDEIRKIIVADCIEIGWKYNTIRKHLDPSLKNQNKGKAGILAAKSRILNKEAQEQEQELEEVTTPEPHVELEQHLLVNKKYVDQIVEKSKASIDAGGEGDVNIVFKEKKPGELKIVNIASIF